MRLVRPTLARTVKLTAAALVSTVVLSAALPAGPAFAAAGPPPGSMASMGDSITRGFNACGWFLDCTTRSYSTGADSAVGSHYLRIAAKNPAMTGHAFNDARTGARVADMPGQAATVVTQHVQYVTMLIGANDACTGSESSMTAVSTFRQSLDASLGRIKTGLPAANVLVISIPDLKRLWAAGKDNANARTAWALFNICQSMLANPTSTAAADAARRDRVRQRVVDFNTQLAQACAAYGPNCAFDGNVTFNYPFSLSQLSTWDYFHPNTSGQAALAQITYQAGFNW